MTIPQTEFPPAPVEPPTASGAAQGPPVFDPPPREASPQKRPGLLARGVGWLMAGESSAWLGSAVFHLLAILILSLLWFHQPGPAEPMLVTGAIEPGLPDSLDLQLNEGGSPGDQLSVASDARDLGQPTDARREPTVAAPRLLADRAGPSPLPSADIWPSLASSGNIVGGGLEGRTAGRRQGLALAGGGTLESEAAVERGLAWLAAHQHDDGAWRFNLETCPGCLGACGDSGFFDSSTAATGLAVLSFLGAGYTHQEGPYQTEVTQALYYLTENMAVTSSGGDLRDKNFGVRREDGLPTLVERVRGRGDNMYSHGIAALALTEGYAMTRDPQLKEAAQLAVKFVVNAQYGDGGWRYAPATETPGPGDMTVTGWQVMALKSGDLAGLEIPYETWLRLDGFLDDMQTNRGSQYRYLRTGEGTRSTTAIGLLCRMFRHWPRDHPPLTKGVALLGRQQPQNNHMYFNYYASQVLHHYGGVQWDRWNRQMRDYLVASQAAAGHETGSWYFDEAHSSHGGRLYTTAMAIMTLEVYYRYMPLYREF